MSGGHSHGGDGGRWFNPADDLTSARTARGLWIAVAVCAVLTVLGLVVLWPGGDDRVSDPALVGADTVEAVVRDVQVGPCTGTTIDQAIDCRFARIEITSGPDRGTRSVIEQSIGGAFRSLHEGDDILVIGSVMADGSVTYQF